MFKTDVGMVSEIWRFSASAYKLMDIWDRLEQVQDIQNPWREFNGAYVAELYASFPKTGTTTAVAAYSPATYSIFSSRSTLLIFTILTKEGKQYGVVSATLERWTGSTALKCWGLSTNLLSWYSVHALPNLCPKHHHCDESLLLAPETITISPQNNSLLHIHLQHQTHQPGALGCV